MARVTLRDVTLAYDDEGTGVPMLLIHGFPLGRWIWDDTRTSLSKRFRVITPDLRGHGDSEVTPGPYTMDLLAEDMARLLDALRIDRAVVGGLSMGGYVTFAFWRKFRDRVLGLILCDTRAAADGPGEKVVRQSTAQTALERGTGAVVDGMLPKLLAPRTLEDRKELVARIRERLVRTDPKAVAGALLGMKDRPDSTPTLATIDVPTLIVVGADDQLTPPTLARDMQSRIKGAVLEVVENAGHLPPVEQPEATSRMLGAFLEKLDCS